MSDKAKHTAGPWEFDPEEEHVTAQGAVIARVMTVEDFPCLDPEEHDIKALCEEFAANAALIAAAPDLLAACEYTLNRLDYLQQLWGKEGVTDGLANAARAAVAKATGQIA